MNAEQYAKESAEIASREDIREMLSKAHAIIEKVQGMKDDNDYPDFSKAAFADHMVGRGSFELGVFAGIYFSQNNK